MEKLIALLHGGGHSCVIRHEGITRIYDKPGVRDLYDILKEDPGFLRGAQVADKVVGKAAAALLITGRIGELYTDLISAPALFLLRESGIEISFLEEVPFIMNRDKSGLCPLENLTRDENIPEKILPLIEGFIIKMNS